MDSFADWLRTRNTTSFTGAPQASSDVQQTLYGKGAVGEQTTGASPGGAAATVAPNYDQILQSSPEVSFANREALTGSAMDASARAAAIRRAVIELGAVPDFKSAAKSLGMDSIGYLENDIDDNTRQLAQKNTQEGLSLMARLEHEHKRVQEQVQSTLASRGIFRSGETGFQMGEQGLRYKQALTDAEKAVMDHISQVVGSFVTNERDRRNMVAQAIFSAMGRVGQTPAPKGGGGGGGGGSDDTPAPTPATGGIDYGTDPASMQRQLPWWAKREAV